MDAHPLGTWSHGIAAVVFGAVALRFLLGWGGNLRGGTMLAALAASAAWAGLVAADGAGWLKADPSVIDALDVIHSGLWAGFVATLLTPVRQPLRGSAGLRVLALVAGVTLACVIIVLLPTPRALLAGDQWPRIRLGATLLMGVGGLILVEQCVRAWKNKAAWGVKPIALTLAAVYTYDVILFAEGALFGRLDADLVAVRGLVQTVLAPAAMLSAARNRGWTLNVMVSRRIVFHSTALLATGLYLLGVAGAGYYLRQFGGTWSGALQVLLLFSAAVGLGAVLLSGAVRSWLRVFVSKHFFSYRYDYREEWLRLTRTLGDTSLGSTDERVLTALANLVESPGGALWLCDGDGEFRQTARTTLGAVTETIAAQTPLIAFLQRTGWVLEILDVRTNPEHYEAALLPSWMEQLARAWIIVPLPGNDALTGFVVLAEPRTAIALDWEVRDVLKTAARQAASYLQFERSTAALLEASQFAAFNRMSAFVVHDLKNLVAQLSLLSRNALRFGDDPEFRADMLMTVEHVTERMQRLLLQLREGARPVEPPRPLALAELVDRALAAMGATHHPIRLEPGPAMVVQAHPDRLDRVIRNLVQNALDATAEGGEVWVRLERTAGRAVLEIGDSGKGMSEDFLRDGLFQPFRTTKSDGLGIGAFESRRYIQELGGTLGVESRHGVGTRFRIHLPLHEPANDDLAREEARA